MVKNFHQLRLKNIKKLDYFIIFFKIGIGRFLDLVAVCLYSDVNIKKYLSNSHIFIWLYFLVSLASIKIIDMYEELEKFLSKQKLEPYLKETNGSKDKALNLFKYNLELSSQMYKALQIFELSTRNIFNIYLSRRYGTNWLNREEILNGNNGEYYDLIKNINIAKERINKDSFDNNDILSNLSIGFWVKLLFNINEDKIWKPCLKKIFDDYNRLLIQDIFLDIREMRNRVSHQETIFNRDVEKTYENICFILKIYSDDLYKWFDCECKIKMPREFND